jgi:hypothetical protein
MITVTESVPRPADCSLSGICAKEGTSVIFDIETTGFSPKTAQVYLIGAMVEENKTWKLTQWLCESPGDESLLLQTFQDYLKEATGLVHFNGDTFDVPFLKKRCELLGLSSFPENLENLDLYRRYRPLKNLLCLSSMNLKALEVFLGLSREDTMNGGTLIAVYDQFVRTKDPNLLQLLLLHNHDDVIGTGRLLEMEGYLALSHGQVTLSSKSEVCQLEDSFSVRFPLALTYNLPAPLARNTEDVTLEAYDKTASLTIRGVRTTLKYFFPDYKNYYYLPMEDTAIHKSVAAYVDKEHREPAKASNCYCKKTGLFLPVPKKVQEESSRPIFRESYRDAKVYVECTEEFLENEAAVSTYVTSFLNDLSW